MMAWVELLANSVIAPFVPAGTIAAFALMRPSAELRVETEGCDCPAGHAERKPSVPMGTTVRLSEYARAVAGMPQALAGILKSRLTAVGKAGPPNGPLALPVSAMRHGATGAKRRAVPGPILPVCVTVKVTPAAVMVPLRAAPGLAATEKVAAPLPVPVAPEAMVRNDALLTAVQVQVTGCAVMVMWPVAAAAPKEVSALML